MSTFSKVIARPTSHASRMEQPRGPTTFQPWSFDPAPVLFHISGGRLMYTSAFGSVPPVLLPYNIQPVMNNSRTSSGILRDLTPSPPPLVMDDSSTVSSYTLSDRSSPEADSPPPSAFSMVAVMGSPKVSSTFEDDYDRPEAHPDFIRRELRRSKSLRRLFRLRNGDYCDSDDEEGEDYSVDPQSLVFREPPAPVLLEPGLRILRGEAPLPEPEPEPEQESVTPARRTSSRLSRRVTPPPPIDTGKKTLRTGERYESSGPMYTIEGGWISERQLSDDGVDGDDEADDLPKPEVIDLTKSEVADEAKTVVAPTKTYASVLAARPQDKPMSRLARIRASQGTQPARREERGVFEWPALVQPTDA